MIALIGIVVVLVIIVGTGWITRRRGKARLEPAIAELGLRVAPTSRGPRRFEASGAVGGTTVDIEIRSVQVYVPDHGLERDAPLQTTFSAPGIDPDAVMLLRPPGGHVTRRELPRGVLIDTADPEFGERFELVATDEDRARRLCSAPMRARLAALPRLAEARWEEGRFSVRLLGAHHDVATLRAGMETAALGVSASSA